MKQERPKWQIFLTTYAIAFAVSTIFGLVAGEPVGEALASGLVRGLLFGTVMAFVLIGMIKANRTYEEPGERPTDEDLPGDAGRRP